ncbi:MAG TPA: hypothetical protein VMH78_02580 [Thermoplasmata archaeon]|nr:hypothetical protein [Thermoplasmata archaeon]
MLRTGTDVRHAGSGSLTPDQVRRLLASIDRLEERTPLGRWVDALVGLSIVVAAAGLYDLLASRSWFGVVLLLGALVVFNEGWGTLAGTACG